MIWQLRADLLFGSGEDDAARLAQRRSVACDPCFTDMQRAVQAAASGRPQDAESVYRRILKVDPNHIHALVESANIDPELTESWTTLGTLQAWGLNQADAVGSFRRALAINPDAARVMLSLGHVYKALGNTADSVHGQDAE